MTLYLAGPMRGHERWNFPAFRDACGHLRGQGLDVVSPHELDEAIGFTETTTALPDGFLEGAMRRDIEALLTVQAIALLPGWEASVGTRFELSVARWLGLDLYTYSRQDGLTPMPWREAEAALTACLRCGHRKATGDGRCRACRYYDRTELASEGAQADG